MSPGRLEQVSPVAGYTEDPRPEHAPAVAAAGSGDALAEAGRLLHENGEQLRRLR